MSVQLTQKSVEGEDTWIAHVTKVISVQSEDTLKPPQQLSTLVKTWKLT